MAKVLFHVDLNAFFASAEELRHPELKGKPLAIGSIKSRGVIATANYEARKAGVHSAMPVSAALKLEPELTVLRNDMEYYRSLSKQFFAILKTFSIKLERVSIDEGYLDVSEVIRKYKRPLDLAVQIQQEVLNRTGLKCSIGIGPTRFLAKMASDMQKPMGISIIRKSEIKSKLFPLPVSRMLGIGAQAQKQLKDLNIETIADLADPQNRSVIEPVLKKNYTKMMDQLTGRSSDQLSFSTTRKTISHSVTFQSDLYSIEEVQYQAARLSEQLFERLKKNGRLGSQISIVLRDGDFNTKMHSRRFSHYVADINQLKGIVSDLIEEYFEPVGYRLLGIRIGSLSDEQIIQQTVFDHAPADPLQSVLDQLNKNEEGFLFSRASDLLK